MISFKVFFKNLIVLFGRSLAKEAQQPCSKSYQPQKHHNEKTKSTTGQFLEKKRPTISIMSADEFARRLRNTQKSANLEVPGRTAHRPNPTRIKNLNNPSWD